MNQIYMHFRVRKIFNNCCIYYYYHEYTTTISEKLVNEITKKRRLFIFKVFLRLIKENL